MQLATCSEERVFLWDVITGAQLATAGPPADIQHEPAGMPWPTLNAGLLFGTGLQPSLCLDIQGRLLNLEVRIGGAHLPHPHTIPSREYCV